LPEARVLRIATQICDAMCHAHHLGLVHRDLKPANIMVADRYGNRDYVKVLDFGIAKPAGHGAHRLTATDVIVGTPTYMAPEQARGQVTDARTDLYALGCVLYHLLAGEPPFESQSPTDLIIRHATELPTPIRERFPKVVLQPRVESIIDRCLQKDPALRYQSAAELKADIERALKDRPSSQHASYGAHGPAQVLLQNGSPTAARADAPVDPSAAAGTASMHVSAPASDSREAELRSLAEATRLERKRGYRVALTLGLLLIVGTLAIGYGLYFTVSLALLHLT
jgi:serine/threonine-protein kinase